jgi:hypothetical protein
MRDESVKLVPEISDELIQEMLAQMRPVSKTKNGRFREINIKGVDPRGESYIWDLKLKPGLVRIYENALNDVKIPTFHTWAYYGFFKPTLAEVLGCINQYYPDWRNEVFYFWLDSPEALSSVIGNYHAARCTLFGAEEHKVIDDRWDLDLKAAT